MKIHNLSEMLNGWFVGPFHPCVINTDVCEVAVKNYKKGHIEKSHFHKIATEVTVVISGTIKMNGIVYAEGSIILMEPGEKTDFEALSDSTNVVFKMPGALTNDKFFV